MASITLPESDHVHGIPALVHAALERYRTLHLRPGSYLQAVLRNDWHEATLRADPDSLAAARSVALYLANELPVGAYGSPEALAAWVARGEAKRA